MASSVETPNIEKKKPKYILITHGDSYLGHALAIYLTEQIYKHDTKKHWFVRVICKEKSQYKEEYEKRKIDVKVCWYKILAEQTVLKQFYLIGSWLWKSTYDSGSHEGAR